MPFSNTPDPRALWSASLDGLAPYVPGEQPRIPGLIKLNTNENPYPPSPAALEAIRAAVGADLRLYPDPDGQALKQTIADLHGLTPAHVFLGNGSDEVLGHAFMALLRHPGRPVLFPDVSYSFYPVWCGLYGIEWQAVPVDESLAIDVDVYARPHGGIVLPNPNAPTGRALGLDALRRLLAASPDAAVIIDEAYVDFGAESAAALVPGFRNLLVVHTLSKSRSLAGLRVGFALGDPVLVEALERVKGSFNSYPLDRLALAGARAALQDTAHFDQTRRQVMASREGLSARLGALGFEVLPSAANFVFVRHPARTGAALMQALRERRILVRHFAKPRIADYLRITVGTEAECQALVAALGEILGT